jgi:hypothetical protein
MIGPKAKGITMENPTELQKEELRAMCFGSILFATRSWSEPGPGVSSADICAMMDGMGLDQNCDPHVARLIGMLIGAAAAIAIAGGCESTVEELLAKANSSVEKLRTELP